MMLLTHVQGHGLSTAADMAQGFDARLASILSRQMQQGREGAGISRCYDFRLVMDGVFRMLRDDLGFSIEDPAHLDRRHVQALFDHLEARCLAGEVSPSAIRDYCRALNQYAALIKRLDALQGAGFASQEMRQMLGARARIDRGGVQGGGVRLRAMPKPAGCVTGVSA